MVRRPCVRHGGVPDRHSIDALFGSNRERMRVPPKVPPLVRVEGVDS